MHMNEHGITLRHGRYRGRLIDRHATMAPRAGKQNGPCNTLMLFIVTMAEEAGRPVSHSRKRNRRGCPDRACRRAHLLQLTCSLVQTTA
jgi:hypothetical protein